MKHAILLLWHKDIEQLKNLIKLFDEDFKFYIHIDKKSIITKEEIGRLKNNQQIAEVYQKYRINWGGFNILKAELLLLQEIVRDNSIGYIHFMSGQDYPIKKLDGIKSFFLKNWYKAQRKAKFYINKCRSASCMQGGLKQASA